MVKRINKLLSFFIILSICFSIVIGNNLNTKMSETVEASNENDTVDVFANLAFPTAEGYGRYANGGRGGRVIEVTNLNDSGEGSLRWALEEESGPRIIVFKVGGIIKLESEITIDSEHGDVYIAGQTAPGDGITLLNYHIKGYLAENIIIRHIRFRLGDSNKWAIYGVELYGCDNSIVDHCSISWAIGYGVSSIFSKNVTVQNTIIAESLYDSYYFVGPDEYLSSWGAQIGGNTASYHHNLFINCAGSIAEMVGTYIYIDDELLFYDGKADIRNNVIYNWYDDIAEGNISRFQLVNNYYKAGAASVEENIISLCGNPLGINDCQRAYLSGNKMVSNDGEEMLNPDTDDSWKLVSDETQNCALDDIKSREQFFEPYINTETADEAYETVVANVGANVPARDYIDSRYIDELVNNKATYTGSRSGLPGIIDSQEDAGGYPNETNFKGGDAPTDTDHDGMPDEWETKHGLNPEYYYDACQVYLSDEGYTNIELYINELAGDPVEYSDNPTLRYTPTTPEPTESPKPTETSTSEPIATATPVQFEAGDVNCDKAVNAKDALEVLKHAAKLDMLTEEKITRADVEADEKIDAKDALAILKIAAKL